MGLIYLHLAFNTKNSQKKTSKFRVSHTYLSFLSFSFIFYKFFHLFYNKRHKSAFPSRKKIQTTNISLCKTLPSNKNSFFFTFPDVYIYE